jgi:predicted nucleotidyltransferase
MSTQTAKSKFLSLEQVLEFLRDHKQEFHNQYGVERIGVFGSILRDELRDDSDIDIAIEMDSSRKSLRNFLAFKRELEQAFNRPVDLGIESTLKTAIKESVSRDIRYV